MANTIIAKGKGVRFERLAGGAITPGALVMLNSSNALVVHATAAGYTPPIVAIEQELFGRDLDTAYANAEHCIGEYLLPGMEAYMLFGIATHAIVIGDLLESAGDGTLREFAPLTGTLTGTPDGALADITFNSTWSSGQANEINVNFEEIQVKMNAARASAMFMALEAVGEIAAVTRYRVLVL